MAKKDESKIGFDPLTWMDDSKGKKKGKKKVATESTSASEGDGNMNIDILEKTYSALESQGEALTKRFYEELFRQHPEVKPMFGGTTVESQHKKLWAAIQLVAANLRKPDALKSALTDLGQRHEGYGAVAAHYPVVAEILLGVMHEFAGDLWTKEVENAWTEALGVIAEVMLSAYKKEDTVMAATGQQVIGGQTSGDIIDRLGVLQNIMQYAPLNIMIADVDENIVYVNKTAVDVLTKIEGELASYLPGFTVASVVGGSIHRYHKDPQKIKNILQGLRPGDTRKGEITPGDFVFEHETRVLTDNDGNRLGYVVQWHDVSERRKQEEQAFRLQRAVDGAQTAMMQLDRDFNITYANESTKKILTTHEATLRSIYPGFKADQAVGSCIDMFHKNPAHQRRLLEDPRNLPYQTDIVVGPLTFNIRVGKMEDLDGNYIGNTLEWADVTELREKEIDVARLTSAIEGAAANIMMCDADLNITYVNPAVKSMMSARQGQIRNVFAGFDANNLIGRCIDEFHKNPAHQRALLADTSRLPAKGEIRVADVEFEVNATAILGPNGEYMGNMVQWNDITEQKDAERQIESLIEAASSGELNERIAVENYEGFMRNLGEGINQLIEAVVVPIREGTRVIQALAEGDLKETMTGKFEGEYAVMRDALNQSIENLRRMGGQIQSSSVNMVNAAGEIAQGNSDLSQRTEEQASSLEETASSMEELTSTVKQNADNARQANQLATGAREQAEKGGDVVQRAVSAMSEINSSSKKIADIIGVIDEIAFQTNLLALNAAVEAARAGEQGRGFAVVAGEVRNLAQRSAGAAKEIKALIQDSVEKVSDGTKLVDQSGETLEEIVGAVKKVSDIIAEIAAASQEQSSGIEQVNKAVTQMDQVTQQNAALVEEAAAASESMDEQARGLSELITFFKIDQNSSGHTMQMNTQSSAKMAPQAAPARQPQAPSAARSTPPAPRSGGAADDGEWEDF